ncbi:transposase [Streptomyces sp. NPDC016566]|uniref:transposase n=1 Tax=Streptomyces sp. NPDC016566 TaxID=3364967 RepID=UPI0036FFC6E0
MQCPPRREQHLLQPEHRNCPETLSRHSQCPLHGSCARTWTGTARRIANSQVAVHLATSRRRGYAAIDRELCAPRSWITDAAGCRLAGIPKGVGFADYGLITADRLLRTRGNAQTSAHSTSGSSAHDRGSRAPGRSRSPRRAPPEGPAVMHTRLKDHSTRNPHSNPCSP